MPNLDKNTQDYFNEKYLKVIKHVQELLSQNTEWKTKYSKYKDDIFASKNSLMLRQRQNLYYYTNFSDSMKTTDKKLYAQIRYRGQLVGKICQTENIPGKFEHILIIDNKDRERNCKTFPGYQNVEELNGFAGKSSTLKCDWHNSKEAQAFRKFFKGSLKKGLKSHSQESHGEHTLESAFLTEIEKRDSITKSLCYIQPVKLKNLRFQFPTGLSASKLHKDITNNNIKHLSYSENGGGIDILARRKKGNQSYLTVIELKDEYKEQEKPEIAIMQAIAYATFIRELIRCDAANSNANSSWYALFGLNTKDLDKDLVIKCVVALPDVKDPNLFNNAELPEILIPDRNNQYKDKLLLHCINIELQDGDKNKITKLIPDKYF